MINEKFKYDKIYWQYLKFKYVVKHKSAKLLMMYAARKLEAAL